MGFDIETIFDIAKNNELIDRKVACVEFEGICSGDYEAQCFDVDKETYVKLEGEEPKNFNKSCFNEDTYRYYPFSTFNGELMEGKKYRVKMVIEEIE